MSESAHTACVAAWIARYPRELPPEQRALAFEKAFTAVWQRAAGTLGEITLTAILDRVLHDAHEGFAELEVLTLEEHGLDWQALHARASGLSADALLDAARFMLVELLTVLGSLTAEILTPALHAALSNVPTQNEQRPPDERAAPAGNDDEGTAP